MVNRNVFFKNNSGLISIRRPYVVLQGKSVCSVELIVALRLNTQYVRWKTVYLFSVQSYRDMSVSLRQYRKETAFLFDNSSAQTNGIDKAQKYHWVVKLCSILPRFFFHVVLQQFEKKLVSYQEIQIRLEKLSNIYQVSIKQLLYILRILRFRTAKRCPFIGARMIFRTI